MRSWASCTNERNAVIALPSDRYNSSGTLPSDRATRSLRPLRTLIPYLGRYKLRLVFALAALVTASGATLMVPLAVREMIDSGFTGSNAASIDRYFVFLIAVVAVLAIASAARYFFVTWLGERVVSDLRADVFSHVVGLSPGFFDREKTGEVVSRLTADTTQIKAAVGASASIALRNLFLFVGAVAMMVVTSPRLSGLVLLAIPFIVLPIVGFGRRVRRKSRLAQDTLAEATAYASEAIGAIRALQSFNNEQAARGQFGSRVEAAFRAARDSTAARATLTAFAIFVIFASVVGVLWYGAQDVLTGRLSPGTLGQFLLYSVFAAGALGELSQVWAEIAQASGAAERLSELLDVKSDIVAPAKPATLPDPPTGKLDLEDVTFAYPTAPGTSVLRGIGFATEPGETVAIVGPSGAGKSTIFNLLMRFYDPQSGVVRIDGIDLKSADPSEIRARLALVPQDVAIFAASARDNIRYGRPDASDDDVLKAARAAYADEFIRAMPQGYDSVIGERGVTLSGGQRQRIAIARAILKDAPILLLDEATSALDAESETYVQRALAALKEGRTTLVIAHRLATVQEADRIVVIDDGRVVEEGDHAKLVARGGVYARLADLQFRTNGADARKDAAE